MKLYYKDEYIRLFQGDCLEVMDRLIEKGIKFDAIITDPPYGTTKCKWDAIIPFDDMWGRLNQLKKDKNIPIILFSSQPFTSELIHSNLKSFKYCWIWNKKQTGNPFLAKKQPLKIHEDICVFDSNRYYPIMTKGKLRKKGGAKNGRMLFKENATEEPTIFNDDYYPTSILEMNNCSNRKDKLHPTQKPVDLCEYLINTYTNENELILDFTCGSGTTLLAAKKLKRRCIGIELEEKYCEIAKQRLEEF
jgi:site-specific DNA-methyltransferase (adenine-specific)